jgi:superfamily II DNA or RNA helicase
MTSAQDAFSVIQPRWALWPHQQRAIDAFEAGRRRGGKATYLVVPPGGGKTLIGLEAARRLGAATCPPR